MSTFVNNSLDPDIWDNNAIRPHIRASLLRIAAEFLIGLNIEVSPKDITLTGSMANFNYNPQSDLDLHVVIGFSDVDNDAELVKQFLMAKKSLWNLKHQITVKGHDVEVYPQDSNEPHHSTGVYSLLNNEWLVKPTRDDPNIDPATVEKKFNSLAAMIDGILGMPDRINHIASVREKLGAMRKLGLSKAGEFSVENLAFKKLRREGYLDRLASAQLQDRDASLSIAEEGYKMKISKRQLNKIIREELRTKPSKHGSLKIIKEEKQKLLKEGSLQGATERLEAALDEYISVLDENMGYDIPRDQLKAGVHNFVDGYFNETDTPQGGWETGIPQEGQRNDGTKLDDMSSSWQQVLGSTRGYPK